MENKDFISKFLDAGTKELGIDCSILVGVVSEIVAQAESRVRAELKQQVAGMKKPRVNPDFEKTAAGVDGFNRALDDVLALLSRTEE